MKKLNLALTVLSLIVFITGCSTSEDCRTKSKQEILKAEKEFEALVKKEGMIAFTKFAAEDAIMNRGDKLVKGQKAITAYYSARKTTNTQLVWTAAFADVAASCDLGYTYGDYTYTVKDSTGKTTDYKGIFHTVWKRQSDGKWKFVWD